MFRRVRLLTKEFFKVPFFDILLLCVIVYLFSYGGDVYNASTNAADSAFLSADNAIGFTASFLAVCTFIGLALFMILSYEFTRRCKTYALSELLDVYGHGAPTLGAQLALLASMAVVYWGYVCCLCLRILHATNTLSSPITGNVLLASVLYGFFPALAGILLGAAGQKLGGRVGFYLFLIASIFFSTQMSRDAYFTLGSILSEAADIPAGIAAQKILDYWFRLPPVYGSFNSTVYGIGIEPFHWALAAMWCLLGGGALLALSHGRLRKAAGAVCFGAALLCAAFVWHRGSNWQEYPVTPLERNVLGDTYYYSHTQTDSKAAEEAAGFQVRAYSMDLRCFSELDANVAVTLDGSVLDAYTFTLAHNFTISRITDGQGEKLDFTRDGDYVTVNNPDNRAISELRFRYSGWHDSLFSSAQGVYLPGYFCYYPIPGRQSVYEDWNLTYPQTALEPCAFSVRVRAMCPVFTNLTDQKDGVFSGTASSLSVVGGLYREETADGVRYVLPWWMDETDMGERLTQAIAQLNADWELDIPLPSYTVVFYSPSVLHPTSSTGTCTSTQDALFVGHTYTGVETNSMARAYLQSILAQTGAGGPARTWFLSILQGILNGDVTGQGALISAFGGRLPEQWTPNENLSDEENLNWQVGYLLASAMEQTSAKEVLQSLYAYLSAGGGDDLDFAQSLLEE